MKINYNESVDVSRFPLPEGNMWGENFKRRGMFYLDKGDTKLNENFINLYYLNVPMILNRSFDIEKPGYRHEAGISYFDFPLDRSKATDIKNNTKPTLTPSQLIIEYYYSFEGISDDKKKYIEELPRQALMSVVRRVSEKKIELSAKTAIPGQYANDILFDGKKISGGERQSNTHGVYDFFNCITNYGKYEHLFEKFVYGEENHIKSNRGITGLEDEIPGYTKEQFTKEYIEELKRLFDELEKGM